MESIIAHDWPGNVRELKNFIERTSITIKNGIISLKDLPPNFQNTGSNNRQSTKEGGVIQIKIGESMDQSEKRIIEETLTFTDGNRTHAAKILKIGLRTLQRKMKRFHLC
jgi:two-component system response regulator HydG